MLTNAEPSTIRYEGSAQSCDSRTPEATLLLREGSRRCVQGSAEGARSAERESQPVNCPDRAEQAGSTEERNLADQMARLRQKTFERVRDEMMQRYIDSNFDRDSLRCRVKLAACIGLGVALLLARLAHLGVI